MHLLHHKTICGLWVVYYNKLFKSKTLFNEILHISILLCHVYASATCVKFEASIWSLNYLHYVYKCVMHVIFSYVFMVDPCCRTDDRHNWSTPIKWTTSIYAHSVLQPRLTCTNVSCLCATWLVTTGFEPCRQPHDLVSV